MRQFKPEKFTEDDWKVEKAQRGDDRYYSEILSRCLAKKRNYAGRMPGIDESEIEDMILEKFPVAIEMFKPGGMSFFTYFENIILRRAIDETRTSRRRRVTGSVEQILEDHHRFGGHLPPSFSVCDQFEEPEKPKETIVIDQKFPRYLLEAWVNHRRSQKALSKAEVKALHIEIAVSCGDIPGQLFLFTSPLLKTCEDDLSLVCELYLKARLASKQPRNLAEKLGITKPLLSAIQSHFMSNAKIVVSDDGRQIDDSENTNGTKADQFDPADSNSVRRFDQYRSVSAGTIGDDKALSRSV